VEPELRQLIDERDITATLHRYASALDLRDWELLATCFTEDAVGDYGTGPQPLQGIEAITALCQGVLESLDHSQHLIGNVEVAVDGDAATASSYLQAQHVRAGAPGGENFIIAGRYVDELARTDEGWRISRRRLERWWDEGNPAVVNR
jgi:ketosteroid isomerase-like protein